MSVDLLERADWDLLLNQRPGSCLSIFLPTHRAGSQTQQGRIRLKNLLRTAERELAGHGASEWDIETILTPLRALVADEGFWSRQSEGLALFAAPEYFRAYRLPIHFRELVVVNDRFAVAPLLPLRLQTGRFYVLGLSMNQVRLLAVDHDQVERVELADVPASFEDALGYVEYNRDLQFHSSVPMGRGTRSVTFHGHGGKDEEKLKKDIQAYFRLIASRLEKHLDPHFPLVLAAIEPHLPLYRSVSSFKNLLHEAVAGNPDYLTDLELATLAREVAEPWFLRERDAALTRWIELGGTPRAARRLEEIVPAAFSGRIDSLFVRDGLAAWGHYDATTGEAEIHTAHAQGDDDLVDAAVAATLANGGEVYLAPPRAFGLEVAAVLRY